jgi:hypothetical protein
LKDRPHGTKSFEKERKDGRFFPTVCIKVELIIIDGAVRDRIIYWDLSNNPTR